MRPFHETIIMSQVSLNANLPERDPQFLQWEYPCSQMRRFVLRLQCVDRSCHPKSHRSAHEKAGHCLQSIHHIVDRQLLGGTDTFQSPATIHSLRRLCLPNMTAHFRSSPIDAAVLSLNKRWLW
ncbi:hypothetical protein AVEN_171513-1 [Araneus ventricosus]|uniref:Uncharacterized protein n=1 Tax=Araneus ventricosus TaxID=182803 RepID=A0A4Y2QSD0_ARAVE|nr:hypothetical protein AVEN_171513-1 [Araneus ventricosus]